MTKMANKPVNPSLAKPAVNIPAVAKIKQPKAPKSSLSPLYGQRRMRPVIQSVPTRTPSF